MITFSKVVYVVQKSFLLLKNKFLKFLFDKTVARQCFRFYPRDK